jgi:hypothetical protein
MIILYGTVTYTASADVQDTASPAFAVVFQFFLDDALLAGL